MSRLMLSRILAVFLVATLLASPTEGSAAPDRRPVRPPDSVQVVTPFEQYFNPFGDPWELKGPSNPSIPMVLTPGCYRRGPKAASSAPNPDEIAFLAKSNSPFVFEECAELVDVTDGVGSPRIKNFTAALHAANPTIKYLGLSNGAVAWTPALLSEGPYPVGLALADASHEEWFAHQKGKPLTRENRLKSIYGTPRNDIWDMTYSVVRDYLAVQTAQAAIFHGYDGVLVDGCFDHPQVDTTIPDNVPPDLMAAEWAAGCVDFLARLKQELPGRRVFGLGYSSLGGAGDEARDFDWFKRRLDVSDGLFWEDPLGSAAYPTEQVEALLNRLDDRFSYARSHNKILGMYVNTNIAGLSKFSTTSAADQHAFARYYLTAYLTIFHGANSPYVHYTPIESSDQFHSAAFFKDWDIPIGTPTTSRDRIGPARYRRDFTGGRIYFNGSFEPLQVSLADGDFKNEAGQIVDTAVIPPKTGSFFMRAVTSCEGRQNVRVKVDRVGSGRLHVEVLPGSGRLRELRFEAPRNGTVDMGDGVQRPGAFVYSFSPASNRSTFFFQRSGGGEAMVRFVVRDGCGDWPTFVGMGAGTP